MKQRLDIILKTPSNPEEADKSKNSEPQQFRYKDRLDLEVEMGWKFGSPENQKEGLPFTEQEIFNFYDNLQFFAKKAEKEMTGSKRKSELRAIGGNELQLFRYCNPMKWGFDYVGKDRAEDERIARGFFLTSYFDQIRQLEENPEIYAEKNRGQLQILLMNLSYFLHLRSDWEKAKAGDVRSKECIKLQYGDSADIALDWPIDQEIKKIIDINLDLIKDKKFDYSQASSLAAFCENDLSYSVPKLWELARSSDKEISQFAQGIIYRLELGRIGMSREGVNYLEKTFDLGEDNLPGRSAFRGTAKGDLVVVDENDEVVGHFNVGDLSRPEKVIKAKMLDFTLDTLFFQKDNETEAERRQREQYLEEFKKNYAKFKNNDFCREALIRFNDLNFREQGWFIIYFDSIQKEQDEGKKKRLVEFAKTYRVEGLKSFLSLEFGPETGDKILEIGEKLETWQAQRVFDKIAELINLVETEQEELAKIFYKAGKGVDLMKIRLALLKEAHGLIEKFASEVSKDSKDSDKQVENILGELEKIDTDIVFIRKACEQLSREEIAELDLREIPKIKCLNMSGRELLRKRDLFDKVTTIITEQFPERGDNLSWRDVFRNECEQNETLSLIVTLANNEIISFYSEEDVPTGGSYVQLEWFNSNPDAPLKGLGEATARLAFLEKRNKNKNFYATAKPHVRSFSFLIEKYGFVSFGATADSEHIHHYARCAKRPKTQELMSKKVSQEELEQLMSSARDLCRQENKLEHTIWSGKLLKVCKIRYEGQTYHDDITKEDPKAGWILKEIENQYNQGYVLARFIPESNTKENQTYYAIFEKDNASAKEREDLQQVVNHLLPKPGKVIDSKLHWASKKALSR